MSLPTKYVTCQCGHGFETQKNRSWCEKCCQPVYYNEKDGRKHKLNTLYIYTIVLGVITFLTYVFIELIATPLLSS